MPKTIVADFIGGVWDGKSYMVEFSPEYRTAVLPISKAKFINKPPEELVYYDVAIYKYITNGIYWFSRIEKGR